MRVLWLTAAALWRRAMFRTRVVAVTGSVGKTTAKESIAAGLAARHRTMKSGKLNHYRGLGLAMFAVRPWHRYAVIEIGVDGPGQMKWFARVLRPDIVVWTGVARTHTNAFASLEQTASEKARLVDALRTGGVAIVNGDDAHVCRYKAPKGVRVLRYGNSDGCDFRASAAAAHWPERLSFDLHRNGGCDRVRTQFVGAHWISSVLPAFAVAEICGVPMPAALAAVSAVPPYTARLSPAALPNGAIFLRDEYNGSVDTLEAALAVLENAGVGRKFLVVSDVSDSRDKPRRRLAKLGRRAAEMCEGAVFIGDHSAYGRKGAIEAGMSPDLARDFYSIEDAVDFLRSEIRAGDLVLLRGRNTDHLSRVYFAMLGDIDCHRTWCRKRGLCDDCDQLGQAIRGTAVALTRAPGKMIPVRFSGSEGASESGR